MIAINQNNNVNPGSFDSPEVSINSNLRRWFKRNIGLWKSERIYFLQEINKSYNICMNLKIESLESKNPWESHYKFTWNPSKKYSFFEDNPEYKEKGEMKAFIQGHQLIRENFYLSENNGVSNIRQVDEHEMIFESSYDDWYILEHTRLLDMDRLRYRVIYSWNKNCLKIVENHHESRKLS
tara:strand:- start:1678 stop:2220 length:543 start_codon:yes stop_codon:yes gene_type:complete